MRLQAKGKAEGLVLESLYSYLGLSRQAFHQRIKRQRCQADMMAQITEQVSNYRRDKDRRAGSRSLFHNLDIQEQYGIGVTKFERLMSEYGLSLRPLRVRVVTTRSVWQSWNYSNLINGLRISNINQVVAGDLTYVSVGRYCYYVFSLTDLCSARLVGVWGDNKMRAREANKALDSWIKLRGQAAVKGCIHHTDGGSQYFSRLYLNRLQELEVRISVAGNCLQNGHAEQRNGLLKHHLIPTMGLQRLEQFQQQLQQIAYFYNFERKQRGLGWRTPVEYETYIERLAAEKRPVKILYDFKGHPSNGQGFFEAASE